MLAYIIGGILLGFVMAGAVLWAKYDDRNPGLTGVFAILGLMAWVLFVAHSSKYGAGYGLAAMVEIAVGASFAGRMYLDKI